MAMSDCPDWNPNDIGHPQTEQLSDRAIVSFGLISPPPRLKTRRT